MQTNLQRNRGCGPTPNGVGFLIATGDSKGSNATCRGHVAATSANTGGNHSSRPFPDAKANESPAGHFKFQFIVPMERIEN